MDKQANSPSCSDHHHCWSCWSFTHVCVVPMIFKKLWNHQNFHSNQHRWADNFWLWGVIFGLADVFIFFVWSSNLLPLTGAPSLVMYCSQAVCLLKFQKINLLRRLGSKCTIINETVNDIFGFKHTPPFIWFQLDFYPFQKSSMQNLTRNFTIYLEGVPHLLKQWFQIRYIVKILNAMIVTL